MNKKIPSIKVPIIEDFPQNDLNTCDSDCVFHVFQSRGENIIFTKLKEFPSILVHLMILS